MEVVFQGEHLAIGNAGHLAVVLSFTLSILGVLAYFFSVRNPENMEWRRLARFAFIGHAVAVLAIVVLLFAIIHSHYFEYHYAWQHSSLSLPVHYMISCFWEGQEGSFLLWIFWHVVMGLLVLRTSGKWEAPVMAVIMLAQVVLCSMLLGVHFGDIKIGSSPFILLRESMANAPIFQQANYLEFIKDGNGLNPLLQNYWMVIHPPTLFFGFAATVVPFAYAIAGLWTKRYREWIKPALPWTLVAVMILGTGIIMGGFWAYESLSFGGYWAWDPVENASLIPWLVLIAGFHVMIISKTTGKSLGLTYVLVLISFILVLYATFLTRSGVLGKTSVHSFTDLGLSGQLLLLLFVFIILPPIILAANRWLRFGIAIVYLAFAVTLMADFSLAAKILGSILMISAVAIPIAFPVKLEGMAEKEENVKSREFWMFIGSLILLISAFQVIMTTSLPVFNKLGISQLLRNGEEIAPPVDVLSHYNKWQLPIALIIAILTGIGQFFKYKQTNAASLKNNLLLSLGLAVLLTSVSAYLAEITHPLYILFLFAAVFAIAANILYLVKSSSKILFSGASVGHVGFGVLLIGVLISSVNKEVISYNNIGQDIFGGGDDEAEKEKTRKENRENILLALNQPVKMGDYEVTYLGDSTVPPNKFFKILYEKKNDKGEIKESFYLYPNAQNNPKMGFVANPDTRHYLSKDVFTHVNFDPETQEQKEEPFTDIKKHKVQIGDTIITENAAVVVEGINPSKEKVQMPDADIFVAAELKVIGLTNIYVAEPVYALKGRVPYNFEDQIDEAGIRFRFTDVLPDEKAFIIETSTRKPKQKYVIMKAIVFPMINFVWAGTIIMVIGFVISIVRRVKEYRRLAA